MMKIALVTNGGRSVQLQTTCTATGVYVRQNGPPGRCGAIELILEPATSWYSPCTLSWEVTDAQIPIRFIDAVISSIKYVMAEEAFDGDYLSGCRIRVVNGAYHETDSKVSCYQMASVMAMREALRAAGLYTPLALGDA
ncbi:hypothetical protein [Massilia sp. CCM 8734]|uniref:hypothetical protein n=1 Tax=Massilia sp. CCM 8734 TaxID=2609283 RepID=UPI001422534C|nr:hypothetical protein [Massilia sp. CCM 8734]NHZ98033.1 hypothetical protein [Massilia sp. CCM 8734]